MWVKTGDQPTGELQKVTMRASVEGTALGFHKGSTRVL